MPAPIRPFNECEIEIVRAAFLKKTSTSDIVIALNQLPENEKRRRTTASVQKLYRALGLRPERSALWRANIAKARATYSHTLSVLSQEMSAGAGDQRFKQAMLKARRVGAENVVLGVVKDRRPLSATVFHGAPRSSGCTSAAAMCTEAA